MIKYSMYIPKESFLHSIDARAKFVLSFFIFITAILFSDAWQLIVVFSFVFMAVRIGAGIPIKTFYTYLKPIMPLIIIMVVLWPFFRQSGDVLFHYWKIKITDEGILMGIAMAFRIATMISASFLLLFTTKQKDIISGLTQMGLPYDYGLTLVIALRYVPTLAGMATTIMDAQRSRGLELDKGSIVERIKKYIPILAPLIVGAIRMAQELAIAIDSRGFGKKNRTYINRLSMDARDYAILGLSILVFGMLVYVRFFGASRISL